MIRMGPLDVRSSVGENREEDMVAVRDKIGRDF